MARKLSARGLIAAGIAASAVAAAGPPALATPALAAAADPAASSPGWTATPLPLPPGGALNSFRTQAISCSSATDCSGGGTYRGASIQQELPALLTLTGTTWTAAEAPMPVGADTKIQNATVASISCPSATRCFAGGNYQAGPGGRQGSPEGTQGMLLTLSDGTWSVATAPLPANAGVNPVVTVAGMSCVSVTWCTAVGQYTEAPGESFGLLLRWAGGKWTAAAAPVPAGSATAGSLEAVSCPSAARCFAGGLQDAAGLTSVQPVMLTWSKHKWAVVKVSLPADVAADPEGIIWAVSCATVTRCIAAGSYMDSEGNRQGMLLSWSGMAWTTREAALPANAGPAPNVLLNAASCPTASRCTVTGTYQDATGMPFGLILNRTGKTWIATEAPPAAYNPHGVSCPSARSCLAVSWGIGQPEALTGP